MKESYVMGVDGGGTKTAFALSKKDGIILSYIELSSINYHEYGIETCKEIIQSGIATLLKSSGISMEEVEAICFGLPCYGENRELDNSIERALNESLKIPNKIYVNDGVVAYFGALDGCPGINIVSGTGSIAYGMDEKGKIARVGGWSEQIGDEGSCYWIAKKGLELFCKEADGRLKKGALYDLCYQYYSLVEDWDFVKVIEKHFLQNRRNTASFQKVVLEAARLKDEEAIKLYELAAKELVLHAVALKRQLHFNETQVFVSLTGGLLNAKEFIIEPLTKELKESGFQYCAYKKSPLEGALLLAIQKIGSKRKVTGI
ncbi:N-acetylglucosamine kinase [Bulleidia sp. zg-1006]|uniref:N-acetylglucosamine kinase n=1 Tax=Bulleidia sp. zg-1006 TaxID=2806552 RepID=UPI001939931A|nr:BadF/BadG/BcrA/BcrD ATPase family protein [Bulleidia sp. zg-1006]QRG86271.1 hypothetical protein JOS54_05255 [Bulleidia sp. zg-1006]